METSALHSDEPGVQYSNWTYDGQNQLGTDLYFAAWGWARLTLPQWKWMTVADWAALPVDALGLYLFDYQYDPAGNRLTQTNVNTSDIVTAGMFAAIATVHYVNPVAGAVVDIGLVLYFGADTGYRAYRIHVEVNGAQTESDLQDAADTIAEEIAAQSSGKLIELLTWGAARTAGRAFRPKAQRVVPSKAINTDTVKVAEGVGQQKWLSPKELRFSQRTITENDYAMKMKSNEWTWSDENPLIVIERPDGTLVSLDNRRLDAALEANVNRVPVRILKPTDTYVDYKTSRTAQDAFDWRAKHPKTLENGGPIPPEGLVDRPKQLPRQ